MRNYFFFFALSGMLMAFGGRPDHVVAQNPSASDPPTAERPADANKRPRLRLAEPLKVMSFNIRYGLGRDGDNRWDQRADLVGETIEMFAPDLLGAQEVLKFQAEFLRARLPGYGFHGVGREDGKSRGEYVPVMYRKSRFELIDAGHFWLSEQPQVAGSKSWDSSLPRMASWVALADRKNKNAKFIFLNTHFDHRGKRARLESARLIRKRIESFIGKGMPVIVVGDFNTTEDGEPYAALISGSPGGDGKRTTEQSPKKAPVAIASERTLIDSYRMANPKRVESESTFSRWDGYRQGSRIDWIIHSDRFTTLQSIINHTNDRGRFPSDHYPVQSILRWRQP